MSAIRGWDANDQGRERQDRLRSLQRFTNTTIGLEHMHCEDGAVLGDRDRQRGLYGGTLSPRGLSPSPREAGRGEDGET